jgi:hypothetical protein
LKSGKTLTLQKKSSKVKDRRVSIASSNCSTLANSSIQVDRRLSDTSTLRSYTTRPNTPPPKDAEIEELTRSIGNLSSPSFNRTYDFIPESPDISLPISLIMNNSYSLFGNEDEDLQEALKQSRESRIDEIQGLVPTRRLYADVIRPTPGPFGSTPSSSIVPSVTIDTHLFDDNTSRAIRRGKISEQEADHLLAPDAMPDEVLDEIAKGLEEVCLFFHLK